MYDVDKKHATTVINSGLLSFGRFSKMLRASYLFIFKLYFISVRKTAKKTTYNIN